MRAALVASLVVVAGCNLIVDFDPPAEQGAQCSDGVDNDGNGAQDCEEDSCADVCGASACGDGVLDLGEECDDHNEVQLDGCEPVTCTYTCASGVASDTRGFDPSTGHCYLGYVDGLAQFYGNLACMELGGYLAVPDDAGEDARIRAAAPADASIGLVDSQPDSQYAFTLVTGNLPATYLHFTPGQPDRPTDSVICASYDGVSATWKDDDCAVIQPYVCELEPSPCGDFVVQPDESCDDGNQLGGDECPADCGGGSVDECALGLDNCSVDAQCIDQPGVPGFQCVCQGGLVGDGVTCVALPSPPTFTTQSPVALTIATDDCTTAFSGTGRKIAIDQYGLLYALALCPTNEARVAVSLDGGSTWSTPTVVGTTVQEAAVVGAAPGRAIVATIAPGGDVNVRQTRDYGTSWGPPLLIDVLADPAAGVSLATDGGNVVVGVRSNLGTLRVLRLDPDLIGFTAFDTSPVLSGDVLIDPAVPSNVWAVGDDGAGLHLQVSGDNGSTFPGPDHTPTGMPGNTDWALGGGVLFVAGTGDGVGLITTSAPDSSTAVNGLPASAPGGRAIAADGGGTAVVAQAGVTSGVELIRLPATASAFDAAVPVDPMGEYPGIVLGPGGLAVVVYTALGQVYVTVANP